MPPHHQQSDAPDGGKSGIQDFNGHIHGPVKGFETRFLGGAGFNHSSSPATIHLSLESQAAAIGRIRDHLVALQLPNRCWAVTDHGWLFLTFAPSKDKHMPRSAPEQLAHVGAIGLLSLDESDDYSTGLMQLAECATKAFIANPTRLFLQAFYVYRLSVEPWVFDRGGMFSGQPSPAASDDPLSHLLQLATAYSQMAASQLGLPSPSSDTLAAAETHDYIPVGEILPELCAPRTTAKPGSDFKTGWYLDSFELKPEPVLVPRSIITRRPICYQARLKGSEESKYVIKFKWRSQQTSKEEILLSIANDRGAWGIVQLAGHGSITSLQQLRRGLEFGDALELVPGQIPDAGAAGDGILAHSRPAKSDCSDTNPNPDRVFAWVAICPIGKPLWEYADTLELLRAFLDAIRAHRSLLQQGRILHRDVSVGNILITRPENPGDPAGILIDLDVAIDLDDGPGLPGTVVGTKLFIGIGTMMGSIHRFRHDLEAFFFVFLALMVSGRGKMPPETSRLQRWRQDATWRELGEAKIHDMRPENFRLILDEFRDEFVDLKPMAEQLRDILFPIIDGELSWGANTTPAAVEKLYNEIESVFDKAISQCTETGGQTNSTPTPSADS